MESKLLVLSTIFFVCKYASAATTAKVITEPTVENHHKLLLVSMDGFSQQYVQDAEKLEAFKYLATHGSKSKFMKPPFPSQTSPSHTTLATGLYTESHNVVHNCYYDYENSSVPQGTFYTTLAVNEWWDNGYENIWITAAKQGLKSGGYLYPGSNATVGGWSATRSILETLLTPTREQDWYDRIDDVMHWFTDDDFDFIALYFENPDLDGHENGPNSEEIVKTTLPLMNRTLGYLLDKVEEYGLKQDLNIILGSDHGMATIDTSVRREDAISIMDYIGDPSLVSFSFSYGPLSLIEPTEGNKEEVYSLLKDAHPYMTTYYREELPDRWNYKGSDRIPAIVVVSDPGYSTYNVFPGFHINTGEHGYDNLVEEMNTIFYGIGPSFKEGYLSEGFESIHVYSLMCHLLGLTPAANNGTLDTTREMLAGGCSMKHTPVISFILSLLFVQRYFSV